MAVKTAIESVRMSIQSAAKIIYSMFLFQMSDGHPRRPQDADNLRRQLWRQLSPSENVMPEESEVTQGAAAAVPRPEADEPLEEKGVAEASLTKDNQPRPHQRLVRRAGVRTATSKRVSAPEGTQSALRPVPRPDQGTRARADRYVCPQCGQVFQWPGHFQWHVAGHVEATTEAPCAAWHRRTQSWP